VLGKRRDFHNTVPIVILTNFEISLQNVVWKNNVTMNTGIVCDCSG